MFESDQSFSRYPLRSAKAVMPDGLLRRDPDLNWGNDIQLVVSLLGIQGRRAATLEVRQALASAVERVVVLAHARGAAPRERPPGLETALRQVCDTVQSQAEARSILISLQADQKVDGLSATRITTVAMVVNELMTNAVRHASEQGVAGHIRVSLGRDDDNIVIAVDDDGLPLPEPADRGEGLGLELAERLTAGIGGQFLVPPPGSKVFTLRVPVERD